MTPREHEDGTWQEPSLSAAEKADGFASVMRRLKGHSPEERVRLQTQAEEVVLGYEAYALGQEHLARGDYEAARRWLRMAADHDVPGAAQALEEIALRGFMDVAAVAGHQPPAGTVPCETILSPHASRAKDGQHRFPGGVAWASVVEQLYPDQTVAAARAQAGQITAQARRDADAILAEARQEADRTAAACAEMVLEVERDRNQAAQLLAEARQEAENVRSELAEIAEGARRGARDMLAKAQRQALVIIDDAQSEAAQIRSRAQRQGSASNRADTQVGWDRVGLAASLGECARPPAGYVIDGLFVDAQDGSVLRPPATVANDPDVRRRFGRKNTAARRVRGAYIAELIDDDAARVPPWQAARRETVQALQWLLEVAEPVLAVIHAEGTVHRDLKPWNLLTTDELRVVDFGVTLVDNGSSALREENAQGSSEQTRTADARNNVSSAAVRYPSGLLRFERTDRASSTTPAVVWHYGARVLPGNAKTDDTDAGDDPELGVEGAGNPVGR
ncbi:hypothetical protein [Streptomyces sp. NPDC008240]|uniref:hypothetical protein n=1 Tax=Streptomyces sp. NPDC008240 TaxID=3364822 RepID=UPI0036ECF013